MRTYNLYFFGIGGEFRDHRTIECLTDTDASNHARDLGYATTIEVWHAGRKVATVRPYVAYLPTATRSSNFGTFAL